MKKAVTLAAATLLCLLLSAPSALRAQEGNGRQFTVVPFEFDPFNTFLVAAEWKTGIGCPTSAQTNDGTTSGTFTDPACATGDPQDKRNEGLLLAKTGPTTNFASAGAKINGVTGMVITELGYDIRKPGTELSVGPRGSHCGAGAPRFNITTRDGTTYFIGCNSPPAPSQTPGIGWLRLRWGVSPTGQDVPLLAFSPAGTLVDISGLEVVRLEIDFDEGQDTGPDNFGAAVLDNIDVNGVLAGRGPRSREE